MKSIVERSSLEDAPWKALQELAERHETLSVRQFANLSATTRLLALGFYEDQQDRRVT
jgi:predicted DNA-binding ribbon-helix-helix protein